MTDRPEPYLDMDMVRFCARFVLRFYEKAPAAAMPERLRLHILSLREGMFPGEPKSEGAAEQSGNDLIGTPEAARILGCTRQHVRRLVADLDGQQVSGRWCFERDVVVAYRDAKAEARQSH